jgi:hypothetical protein
MSRTRHLLAGALLVVAPGCTINSPLLAPGPPMVCGPCGDAQVMGHMAQPQPQPQTIRAPGLTPVDPIPEVPPSLIVPDLQSPSALPSGAGGTRATRQFVFRACN